METSTLALLVMGAIALIVIILILAGRTPGPSGTNVYDSAEPPTADDSPTEQAPEDRTPAAEDENQVHEDNDDPS
jgi:hypothetical protein